MNKVFLIGNLTRDPELSETQSGTAYCRMSIAVNRPYSNSDGNRECDFFNLVAWRGIAETCGRFLSKGKKISVVGVLQNRSYEDKDGNKRTATEVVVSEVEFLSGKTDSESEPDTPPKQESGKMNITPVDDDDDLPFL